MPHDHGRFSRAVRCPTCGRTVCLQHDPRQLTFLSVLDKSLDNCRVVAEVFGAATWTVGIFSPGAADYFTFEEIADAEWERFRTSSARREKG